MRSLCCCSDDALLALNQVVFVICYWFTLIILNVTPRHPQRQAAIYPHGVYINYYI